MPKRIYLESNRGHNHLTMGDDFFSFFFSQSFLFIFSVHIVSSSLYSLGLYTVT